MRALSKPTVPDQFGNLWQYNSRSDKHSKAACWGIAFDLLVTSSLLRGHVTQGKVILGVNHEMRDFGTGRKKNLDLVIARPGGESTGGTFADLAGRYRLDLTEAEEATLAGLPALSIAPVGAVQIALEAKATMTAHIRSLPRLYDELNSSHLCVHGASRQALAIGFAMVNASARFVSSDLNKRASASTSFTVSDNPQPRSLQRTLTKLAEIPRRSNTRETGFDALGIVVVDGVNDGTQYQLVDAPPAPQPGDAFHYDGMISRMANEYDTTFALI